MKEFVKPLVVGVLAFGFIGVVACVPESDPASPKQHKIESESPGDPDSYGDGNWVVGKDIPAGTYRTEGDPRGIGCYWERAENSSGELDSIIANDYLTGPGRVMLSDGEVVKFTGDCMWKEEQ